MKSIKSYFDYRDYLLDFYLEKKRETSFFSLRYMGSKVGVDPSHLVKIFRHKRHIGNSLIEVFIEFCGLKGSDAEYFANLVRFNKAKTDIEGKIYYEKLLALKGSNAYSLEKHQYEFYSKWYYSAILTLLDFYPLKDDFAALAAKISPPISEAKARKAVKLLEKLGLIRKNEKGNWELTHKIITSGDHGSSIAVKSFQEATMRLAIDALYNYPPEKRNISTVTITVAEKNLPKINSLISQFRESLLQLAREETHPDYVYQLNIQFFPLTR